MNTLSGRMEGILDPRRLAIPGAVVLGGLAVAWGVANKPLEVGAAIALGLLLVFALYVRPHLPRLFLVALGIVLVGYAFADKGFAYLGYPPLFVSEMLLLLGLVTFALSGGFRAIRGLSLTWLWLALAGWGAIQTVPYVGTYELDALRDAVIWGYGIFALIVAACLLRTGWLVRVPSAYRAVLPWLLVWVPIAVGGMRYLGRVIPEYPGSGVAIIHVKPGDMAVHLAGAGAFVLAGLYHKGQLHERWRGSKEWLLWVPWLAGFLVTATQNRGGMLAIFCSLSVVLFLQPGRRWLRIALVGAMLGSVAMLSDLESSVIGKRQISPSQIVENFRSILNDDIEGGDLAGTKHWRIVWWEAIRDDTLFGPHFWTGRGFGVNLGQEAGVYVHEDTRSPHNGHLTVLARAGVPGMVLWLLLQGVFAVSLLRAYFRSRSQRQDWWAGVFLWLLAYWVAFQVNATFDVYLEGPQGGIWFWAVFGTGMAALEVHRRNPALSAEDHAVRAAVRPHSRAGAGSRLFP